MSNIQTIEVQIINAFTDNNKGGNPAGVVFNADLLTSQQKQFIAAKAGLSETAFVSNSTLADFKLEFFTPTRQIAHCGHATIATFSYMAQKALLTGSQSSKETIDGIRKILIQNGSAYMEQIAPTYENTDQYKEAILDSLGITEKEMITGAPLCVVNTGNSFAIIPVSNEKVLHQLAPDFDSIQQISEELNLIGFYVFCQQTQQPDRDACARMFAPRYGINEEAGTGMAAGPLACYLFDKLHLKKERILIEQGYFMKPASPSLITVDLTVSNKKILSLMAGGTANLVNTLVITL